MTRTAAGGVTTRMFGMAFSVSLAALCAGIALGYASMSSFSSGGSLVEGAQKNSETAFLGSFVAILVRNTGAALLLFSGVITAGFSTVIALGLMAAYIGATFGAAAGMVGFQEALTSIALYAPLEFLGLLLAASAGLLPLVAGAGSALGGAAHGESPLRSYVDALGPSLKAFGGAVAVILVAAVVESLVITSR
ncbi:stage II sporulation protein M [Streptomyces sp. NPDC057555]|uniref:stage II sporulation protein M n=1 Tax=Streptomyces sp. NPDC057555 TaxID=3346166 RepID=UPI0036AB8FA3